MRERKNSLVLFSKPPAPGLVKTRLTTIKDGVFTPEVASALYHCMLFDVTEVCCAALADLEARSAERAEAEGVRDVYELVISTTPASNVGVMRDLYYKAGTWPRPLTFIADEGSSFDEHYNHAFAQAFERGARRGAVHGRRHAGAHEGRRHRRVRRACTAWTTSRAAASCWRRTRRWACR